MNISLPIFILFALKRLSPSAIVYDVTDDYELFLTHRRVRKPVNRREKELVSKANQIYKFRGAEKKGDIITCINNIYSEWSRL